jgi:hypothetical protein
MKEACCFVLSKSVFAHLSFSELRLLGSLLLFASLEESATPKSSIDLRSYPASSVHSLLKCLAVISNWLDFLERLVSVGHAILISGKI